MKELKYCQRGAGYIEANRFDKGEVVCRNCKTYPSGTVARCDKPKGEKK